MAKEIKYSFAIDDGTKQRVSIDDDLQRSTRYVCLGCGEEMSFVRRSNADYRDFFRHKVRCNCSRSRYIHTLAEQKIKERFDDKSKPFKIAVDGIRVCKHHAKCIQRGIYCAEPGDEDPYDLHQFYDTCTPEKKVVDNNGDNYYVADLLLTHSLYPERKLLIEIWVTHENSVQKRESGLKIIEVHFTDDIEEGEKQIYEFCKSPIIRSSVNRYANASYTVRFDGFKANKHYVLLNRNANTVSVCQFFISRKWRIISLPCHWIYDEKRSDKVVFEALVDADKVNYEPINDTMFFYLQKIGYNPQKKCRYCFFSTYGLDDYLVCKRYKTKGTPHFPDEYEAEGCMYFSLDRSRSKNYTDILEKVRITEVFKREGPIEYTPYVKPKPRLEIPDSYFEKPQSVPKTVEDHIDETQKVIEPVMNYSDQTKLTFANFWEYDSTAELVKRETSSAFAEPPLAELPSKCKVCSFMDDEHEIAFCKYYSSVITKRVIDLCEADK